MSYPGDEAALDRHFAQLEQARAWSPRVISKLENHLRAAPDQELFRINAITFASAKSIDPDEAVDLMVHASATGLFYMDWLMVCPDCTGIMKSYEALAHVHSHFNCWACQRDYVAALDDQIAVGFTVSPKIRGISFHDPKTVDVQLCPTPFLTAKRLINTHSFRTLFRSEVIRNVEALAVRSVALLFTDLKGSTALYGRIGDLNAYALVRQHFDALQAVIARRRGAVIKTIGDAVMAAFTHPCDAVAAALEMGAAVEIVNQGRAARDIILKIGVHAGPAITVTLNETLDYFGQTVNEAARIQALAGADQLVLSEAVWNDEDVRPLLEGRKVERSTASLKGIEGDTVVYRISS